MTFFVLMTCHNRRDTTVACLRSLLAASLQAQEEVKLILFDDGSLDGTNEGARLVFPGATILQGSGSAFWARGMANCESVAMRHAKADDHIVWLNDDVILDENALKNLRDLTRVNPGRVIVGGMRDPESGVLTYAGFQRSGWHPLKFDQAAPADAVRTVDAFNGNLVAVPVDVIVRLGGIDGAYSHAFADIDFGLRLAAAQEPALLAPGTFGTCARNPPRQRRSLGEDWRAFRSAKGGGNPTSLRHFFAAHAPRRALAAIVYTYIAWWVREISVRLNPRGAT